MVGREQTMRLRSIFWMIFLIWGAVLFGVLVISKLITPFEQVTSKFNIVEQIFYALVLAPYPALLVFWALKKSKNAYAFHRMLLHGATIGLLVFVLQIMLFILTQTSTNLILPIGSNLFDTALAKQVAVYSQVPMLSHFLAIFLFTAAFASRLTAPGGSIQRTMVLGVILYIPYLAGFYFCHILWHEHLLAIFMPPNSVNIWMLFVHWIPTLYFLALTYLCSVIPKK